MLSYLILPNILLNLFFVRISWRLYMQPICAAEINSTFTVEGLFGRMCLCYICIIMNKNKSLFNHYRMPSIRFTYSVSLRVVTIWFWLYISKNKTPGQTLGVFCCPTHQSILSWFKRITRHIGSRLYRVETVTGCMMVRIHLSRLNLLEIKLTK